MTLALGVYQYRFVVYGTWCDDPRCAEKAPNGTGEENCLVYVLGGLLCSRVGLLINYRTEPVCGIEILPNGILTLRGAASTLDEPIAASAICFAPDKQDVYTASGLA